MRTIYIYISTDTRDNIENTTNTTTNTENVVSNAHAQEDVLVGVGEIEKRGSDVVDVRMEAMEQFKSISNEIDKVVGWWNQTKDTNTAEASLKSLCGGLRGIKQHIPSEDWLVVENKLKSIRSMMNAPTSPTYQTPQTRQNTPSAKEDWFDRLDSIIRRWNEDQNGPVADVAIGQVMSSMQSNNASPRQWETAMKKINGFYNQCRGIGTPDVGVLLRAMTPAQTTQPLCELFLSRSQAETITSSSEWVKCRQNGSEGQMEGISEEEAKQAIGWIDETLKTSQYLFRSFRHESVRVLEGVKAYIRQLLAESDRWVGCCDELNKAIGRIIAVETNLYQNPKAVTDLAELALSNDDDVLVGVVLNDVVREAEKYNNTNDVDTRGPIVGMRLKLENKLNRRGEYAPDCKPTGTDTDAETDDMPF